MESSTKLFGSVADSVCAICAAHLRTTEVPPIAVAAPVSYGIIATAFSVGIFAGICVSVGYYAYYIRCVRLFEYITAGDLANTMDKGTGTYEPADGKPVKLAGELVDLCPEKATKGSKEATKYSVMDIAASGGDDQFGEWSEILHAT